MHPEQPAEGVRYEFERTAVDEAAGKAWYRVTVRAETRCCMVDAMLSAAGVELGDVAGDALDDAHRAQLVALARTLAKKSGDEPWPRRINRWRSPGVR